MNLQEFIQNGLLDEFAERVLDAKHANLILEEIGLPRGHRPSFPKSGGASVFWLDVAKVISSGMLASGTDLQPLVNAAARNFPGNAKFKQWVRAANPSKVPDGSGSSAPSRSQSASPQPDDSDAFVSYSRSDLEVVREIVDELRRRQVRVWFDQSDITNESAFTQQLERAMKSARTIAVLVGRTGLGKWQALEVNVAIDQHVNRKVPLIPVLLNGADSNSLPPFLRTFNAVLLPHGADSSDGMNRLFDAI
jgi:hypothetical protein